ncbi:MAG: hypothetical protein FWC26_02095, partial [Fibromonadales bacterium]|nr:hypothetical protein [Fibromonadales bacterium]
MRKIIFILFCSFAFANAVKGPEYRSPRVHGMGGAFVAVADGKEALYYNPAGLNLISRMGNFEKNPEMGYLPKNGFELRFLTLSGSTPISANTATEMLDLCGAPTIGKILQKFLFLDFNYLIDLNWCPEFTRIIPDDTNDWPDSLQANQDLMHKFTRFDRLAMGGISGQIAFVEFAMHNFGLAIWLNGTIDVYPEFGIIIPTLGYEPIQADFVAQTAMAFSPFDKWAVGIGFKVANRQFLERYEFWPKYDLKDVDFEAEKDTLTDRFERAGRGFTKFEEYKYAMDFGLLYQITRQVRLGTSLRNVFFSKLADSSITPDLSFGAMASPMALQSNSWFTRKVHFAMDYVDVLNDNLSDMPLSHLNFGAEIEQTVIPSPFQNMSLLPRIGFGVLGGAAGFAIGYVVGRGTLGNTVDHIFDKADVAFGVSGALIGGLLGAAVGGSLGSTYGFGNDMLKVALGGGFEGGYLAWTVGLTVAEAVNLR